MKLRYKIAGGILAFFAVAFLALGFVLSYDADCVPAPEVSAEVERMKAIVYRCYGSPDVLEYVEVEKPIPGDDEVLVKVHAAAVNPYDWHYMRGSPYLMRLGSGLGAPDDTSLGVDFAGTVEAVGSGVDGLQPGDEVFGGAGAAFAQYVNVQAADLALKPADVTFEQAASVPIAAVTALQALRDKGNLQSGQKVLINGASGGVGTFAVQIAKALGAEVTGVCSTRNVDMVRSIGADHVFDYTKENYTESERRYDLIIDNVGNHSLRANRKVMNPEGTLVIVGAQKGDWIAPLMRPISALLLNPFVSQNFAMFIAEIRKEDLTYLADLMQTGRMTPVIDRRYPLSEVRAAMEYSETGRARGKIIIEVD